MIPKVSKLNGLKMPKLGDLNDVVHNKEVRDEY